MKWKILASASLAVILVEGSAANSVEKSETVKVPQIVHALPGKLDDIPMFNSNSPEVVNTPGILLSTFPPDGMEHHGAHLNYAFDGRFDVFFHHINNRIKEHDSKTLLLALVLRNASATENVTVKNLIAASYLSRPDSPFKPMDPVLDNKHGQYYAGPGDRVTLDMLRGHKQHGWRDKLTIPPGATKVFFVLPVPVHKLDQPLNGRSGLLKLESNGPVYAALLANFGEDGDEKTKHVRMPGDDAWISLVQSGKLCGSREIVPSAPGAPGPYKYGRVAGVSKGTVWSGEIPLRLNGTVSYPLSSVHNGTFGTGQVQSAPMLVRYPDTAYESHGNYGVEYSIAARVSNDSEKEREFALTVQSPLKHDTASDSLEFFESPANQVFFRGSIRLAYEDDNGKNQVRFIHLVERRGERMPSLLNLVLKPHETRRVDFAFYYPPDSTPPQVLTLSAKPVE